MKILSSVCNIEKWLPGSEKCSTHMFNCNYICVERWWWRWWWTYENCAPTIPWLVQQTVVFFAHIWKLKVNCCLFSLSRFFTRNARKPCANQSVTAVRHVRMVFGSDVAMSIFTTFYSIIIIYSRWANDDQVVEKQNFCVMAISCDSIRHLNYLRSMSSSWK